VGGQTAQALLSWIRAGSVSQRSSRGIGGRQRSPTVQRNRRSPALQLMQLGRRRRALADGQRRSPAVNHGSCKIGPDLAVWGWNRDQPAPRKCLPSSCLAQAGRREAIPVKERAEDMPAGVRAISGPRPVKWWKRRPPRASVIPAMRTRTAAVVASPCRRR
jgi:hypothetical protein